MIDLLGAYNGLPPVHEEGEVYSAQILDQCRACRIARDKDGNPSLLFQLYDSQKQNGLPIELRNLSYVPSCIVEIQGGAGTPNTESVALLKCITEDPVLRAYFLKVLAPVVFELGNRPTELEVSQAVTKVVELFRALEVPGNRSLQGLWCELLVISRSHRLRQAAMAWHAAPKDKYDFVAGRQSIEVKSCKGPLRIHHFSLSQVLPHGNTDVVVASFVLRDDGSGISIGELWDQILQRRVLSVELHQRLDRILTFSLGRDWRMANRVLFDPDQAWERLRVYDIADVPRVNDDVPAEVSNVRFASELTDTTDIPLSVVAQRGSLFDATFGTP